MFIFILLALGLFQPDYEKELINYFLVNKTENHLVLDRESNRRIISISATGLGYCAWAKAAERKMISREQAIQWICLSVEEVARINIYNGGFFYHFTYLDGKPAMNEEISTLDTGLYLACLQKAAKQLKDDHLSQLAWRMRENVNISLVTDGKGFIHHGFFNKDGSLDSIKLIPYTYQQYDESVILYKVLNLEFHPTKVDYSLPLFTYYYPLMFYDDKFILDHLGKAIDYQMKNNNKLFGYTMCDLPNGKYGFEPGVISPLAIFSCEKYFPVLAKQAIVRLNSSPITPSMTCDGKWKCTDKIGIDFGACLLIRNR